MPGYSAPAPTDSASLDTAAVATDSAAGSETSDQKTADQQSAEQQTVIAEGDAVLPDQVAYMPTARPDAGFPVAALAPAAAQTTDSATVAETAASTPLPASKPAQTAADVAAVAAKVAAADADVLAHKAKPAEPAIDNPVYVTAGQMPQPQAYAPPKKKGFFASLFGTSQAEAAPAPIVEPAAARESVKPIIQLASAKPDEKPTATALASLDGDDSQHSTDNALPGVRQTALFEITRKSGLDDDSDVDLNEDEGGAYRVASAAGLARLAPNGLLKQTEGVDVACLKPSLVRVLKTIEAHYGRKMIVTSGYRDPMRNRLARGAKRSLHMYCAAADIQVPGVSKWELASYVRSMPGRGGVGTYCHTESVHVDVGPERDWNWRCRRRR
jgi:uncharacterized protein YcbK (DUF882 family)